MKEQATYRIRTVLLIIVITELVIAGLLLGMWWIALDTQGDGFLIENPWMLWFLGAIPALSIIFLLVIRWKNKALLRFANASLLRNLIPNFSKSKAVLKFILFKLGVVCIIVGMAQPQFGTEEVETTSNGADIILAVDVSNSMLAQDLKPNRLERSKLAIEQLVNQLKGDRIGIITFAGIPDVHVPITNDYRSVKSFLGSVSTDFPVQGTAVGKAIDLGIRSFDKHSTTSKVIIIISDGENHEDDALESAKEAAELGIIVHTIGVGSPDGVPIPVRQNSSSNFRQDEEGNTVVTKLNEKMMKEVADAGNGIYVRASNADVGLNIIMKEIRSLENTEGAAVSFVDYREHFQIFLLLGFLFLLADVFITDKRNTWTKNVDLFS